MCHMQAKVGKKLQKTPFLSFPPATKTLAVLFWVVEPQDENHQNLWGTTQDAARPMGHADFGISYLCSVIEILGYYQS